MAATAKLMLEELLSENLLDFGSDITSDDKAALSPSFEPYAFEGLDPQPLDGLDLLLLEANEVFERSSLPVNTELKGRFSGPKTDQEV